MLKLKNGLIPNRPRRGIVFEDEHLAQQHSARETDINVIVDRWLKTGEPPIPKYTAPSHDDYTGITDFHTAMNVISEARNNFMKMPAEIRAKFENSPQKFLDFCDNPKNIDELVEMKLATKREPPIIPPKMGDKQNEIKEETNKK